MQPNSIQLERIIDTLTLQFDGFDIESVINNIEINISKKTGRIRAILDRNTGRQLFSLRTSDGRFLPTYEGGLILLRGGYLRNQIVMTNEAAPFIAKGKSAFCKHVMEVDKDIVPESEVLLVDEEKNLLAVGTAKQPGYVIDLMQHGIAAKVKHSRES